MPSQKISVGSFYNIGGKPYECVRITRSTETYRAWQGQDYMDLGETRLSSIRVLKKDVQEHKVGDIIEVEQEVVRFQGTDGPLVVYNVFSIRKVQDESTTTRKAESTSETSTN